jgi:hypothetical protein
MRNDDEKHESGTLLDDVDMEEINHYYDSSPTSSTRAQPPLGQPPRGKGIARHRDRKRKLRFAKLLEWMRWGVVIMLQGVIVVLLVWHRGDGWSPETTETGGDINGIYVPRMCFLALGITGVMKC